MILRHFQLKISFQESNIVYPALQIGVSLLNLIN